MSNSIDQAKFYMFLASQDVKGGWEEVADGYNGGGKEDDIITKQEFRYFVNGEFNKWSGESLSAAQLNDLVDKFWSTIDKNQSNTKISGSNMKNRNALDENELQSMEKRVEAYSQLNNYVKEMTPTDLSYTSFPKELASALAEMVERYVASDSKTFDEFINKKENLPEINKIIGRCAANAYAEKYQTEVKDLLPQGYDIAGDKALQELIQQKISEYNFSDDAFANKGKSEVFAELKAYTQTIVDAYLASAGIGGVGGVNPEIYEQPENAPLNDLQIAKAKEDIIKGLGNQYNEYKELYDSMIEDFLSGLTKADFDKLAGQGIVNAFKASEAYKDLQKMLNLVSQLDSAEKIEAVLAGKIPEEIAKDTAINIASDRNGLVAIVKEVFAKNPNATMDDVIDHIILGINKYLDESNPDYSVKDLNALYTARETVGKEYKDLNSIQLAALHYCASLEGKNENYANAVKEVFGDDYNTEIKNTDNMASLINKMQTLMTKVTEIERWENAVVEWKTETNHTMPTDSSRDIALNATITNDGSAVSTNVTFVPTVISGDGEVECNGKTLTVTSGSTGGELKVEVYAMVNGIKVGSPMTLTIECKPVMKDIDWSTFDGDENKYTGTMTVNGTANDATKQTVSLSKMYEVNACIAVPDWMSASNSNIASFRSAVMNNIGKIVDLIYNSCLPNADLSALNTAKEKTLAVYKQAINSFDFADLSFGEKGDNLNTQYEGETYTFHAVKRNYKNYAGQHCGHAYNSGGTENALGLDINCANVADKARAFVNVRCLMDIFEKFYKEALGV